MYNRSGKELPFVGMVRLIALVLQQNIALIIRGGDNWVMSESDNSHLTQHVLDQNKTTCELFLFIPFKKPDLIHLKFGNSYSKM